MVSLFLVLSLLMAPGVAIEDGAPAVAAAELACQQAQPVALASGLDSPGEFDIVPVSQAGGCVTACEILCEQALAQCEANCPFGGCGCITRYIRCTIDCYR